MQKTVIFQIKRFFPKKTVFLPNDGVNGHEFHFETNSIELQAIKSVFNIINATFLLKVDSIVLIVSFIVKVPFYQKMPVPAKILSFNK